MSTGHLVNLRQLSERYADAVDRRDAEALLAVFAPDGSLRVQRDDGPVESEWSGAGVAAVLESVNRYDRTFHQIGGCVFEVEGEGGGDGATGRIHLTAHHYERTANGPVDLVMFIVYHDRYTSRPEGWLIQERRVAVQWTELHPAHPLTRTRPAS